MFKIEKLNENCEYTSGTQLKGKASKYISIPLPVILNADISDKRLVAFTYFRIKKGLDDSIGFTIPSLVKWCGMKPDNHSDGTNSKFLEVVNDLSDMGYLTFDEPLTKIAYAEGEFNSDQVHEECLNNRFAILYLDEIDMIMNCKKTDRRLNTCILLLVFAYLRCMIFKRSNELKIEEQGSNHEEDVEARRKKCPEAYADNYKNIGEQLGISERMASKAVSILEQELGLIVTDETTRIQNEKGEFYTQYTLFANSYKREGGLLLDSGDSYSKNEIQRKAESIQVYNKKFKIKEKKKN